MLHEYAPPERHGRGRDERPNYGLEAAAALEVEPARVFKTLVAVVDGTRLVVAILPVTCDLDLKRLAQAVGGRRATLSEPAAAERATGYVIGGISPLGQRRPLPTVLDTTGIGHQTILVSAGRRGLQVEVAPGDLVRAVGGIVRGIQRQ